MQVAPTDMTVLITGESGSGKESFSKIIHNLSHRKHGQFIAINCGAIPEGTIDSELFGHEKGSFTGASDARKGYFEVTNGGTIFLDEIGEMPLGTQARLLRVLENGEFIRVGSSKVQKTDVRVVAATNVNLLKAVDKKKFREDLYYRLNTVPIYVPPLRERDEDVDLLFRKFASDFAEKYRVKPIKLSTEAKTILLQYNFPGNIRQLKNLVEQISVLEFDREINDITLLKYLPKDKATSTALAFSGSSDNDFSERDILYQVLFDLKKDMNELKKLVFEMIKNGHINEQVINEHKDLFQNITNQDFSNANFGKPSAPMLLEQNNLKPIVPTTIEINKIVDIIHEQDIESLSIEDKEKELILKALKKNNNKRKYAAQDLGISERTLYRKIKQYDIEEV
jgi:transcriptional regulator with PAS, ATPase and Fis domain